MKKSLVYLPQYNQNTFLLLVTRAGSASLREFPQPAPGIVRREFTEEALAEMLEHPESVEIVLAGRVPGVTDGPYWFELIQQYNSEFGLINGVGGPATRRDVAQVVPLDHEAEATFIRLQLDALTWLFRREPENFFSEKDIHASFDARCRGHFGTAFPLGSMSGIDLFRHEYNTIWRYRRANGFRERYSTEGVAGSVDFAVLDRGFVEANSMIVVRNKNEGYRDLLRSAAAFSPAIVAGIEFKMAIARADAGVGCAAISQLRDGMLEDCRKLAHERVPFAYVVAFSHGPEPANHLERVHQVLRSCTEEYRRLNPHGTLTVRLVTPTLETERVFGPRHRPRD